MPEFNLNVERSRRIRKDIQGKSALHERAIEVILIEIVRCIAVATVLHRLIITLPRLALKVPNCRSNGCSAAGPPHTFCVVTQRAWPAFISKTAVMRWEYSPRISVFLYTEFFCRLC